MEIPAANNFAQVKLLYRYHGVSQIQRTGIFYCGATKTFDCWWVEKRHDGTVGRKQMVTQINEVMGLEDKCCELFDAAQKQLDAFEERVKTA